MKVITIMADYGCYAWLKDEDDGTTLVGPGVTSEVDDFEFADFSVSPGLKQAFEDWHGGFNLFADHPTEDWTSFHERGMELSRRLKEQIGDQARVIYSKPGEDPARWLARTERTEILADGTLKPITVRLWSPPEGT